MSLSESQSVSENGENRKILQHDRNRRYCHEHSQKLHTNEKLHASERLWSESHFRLVNYNMKNYGSRLYLWFKMLQDNCIIQTFMEAELSL